ncbi:M28 family metallopeptidase [Nocardia sp. CDC159]|uniref:M28 family metallopeptidase n=1 Tax=Nocardia pulmonis TaxID=2951408 RepID=A0A9X2IVR1_9NOCA|nr:MULTISPECIES: M28 family metallopeptidase [Nocardia]MCM6773498.1 M28 family metallopeptidase [Nocardia pulmonis]MCM6786385.1 M28 family metallopeptidase [Nocardia sp. CDC159]
MPRIFRRARAGHVIVAAAALPLVFSVASTGPAYAEPGAPPERQIADSIKAPDVKQHLERFQAIANANGRTRAAGTPGYDASRDYVAGELRRAGYQVTLQAFEFQTFRERTTAVMEQVSNGRTSYKPTAPGGSEFGDFATLTYSGSGEAKAKVQGVDLVLPPGSQPNSSTSGCEAADFAGFTRGNIALLQRGSCTFADKARNAQAAGAAGVIIFNEGQPGRTDTFTEPLDEKGISVPVVGTSFAVGKDLAAAKPVVRLKTDTESAPRTTHNVLAESKQGNPDKVVMAGAHLDSVRAGAGINDNGSGSAGLLEVALQMASVTPKNKLRFAWWGAEELGLIGSKYYVQNLSAANRAKIKLYLNFDMIGSTNFAYKIYNGSSGPAGSAQIEQNFNRYFDSRNLPHVRTPLDGRSDYGPFMRAGIPVGGLFTGAEGIKTSQEQRLFGGQAGRPYDPCYHRSCDTTANISDTALTVNTGAIADAMQTYAAADVLPGRTPVAAETPTHE